MNALKQTQITVTVTDSGAILIQSGYQMVRLGMYVSDPANMSYESVAEDDDDWVMAPELTPLHLAWHHAMVFLGAVEPDAISHPPK